LKQGRYTARILKKEESKRKHEERDKIINGSDLQLYFRELLCYYSGESFLSFKTCRHKIVAYEYEFVGACTCEFVADIRFPEI
jgi:hypothetical protein